jgi:hypothetical protein
MLTVSPIIPSIEPDRTSFTVSVIDDEVLGLFTVGDRLAVLKFGCTLGAVKFGCTLGAVKFGCTLGAVKFVAVMFDWAFDRL